MCIIINRTNNVTVRQMLRNNGARNIVRITFCPTTLIDSEAVVRRCSVKKVFLKISQNSQETPVPKSLF